MRTFMESHKQLTALKSNGYSTADMKKDIAAMEDEKDQLVKRVDRLKRKVLINLIHFLDYQSYVANYVMF